MGWLIIFTFRANIRVYAVQQTAQHKQYDQ